jgi:hypothetical protein
MEANNQRAELLLQLWKGPNGARSDFEGLGRPSALLVGPTALSLVAGASLAAGTALAAGDPGAAIAAIAATGADSGFAGLTTTAAGDARAVGAVPTAARSDHVLSILAILRRCTGPR